MTEELLLTTLLQTTWWMFLTGLLNGVAKLVLLTEGVRDNTSVSMQIAVDWLK